jgi:hypothetical protein
MVSYNEMKKKDSSEKKPGHPEVSSSTPSIPKVSNFTALIRRQITGRRKITESKLERAEREIDKKIIAHDRTLKAAEKRIETKAISIEAEKHIKNSRLGSFGFLQWVTNKKTGTTVIGFGKNSSHCVTLSANAKNACTFLSLIAASVVVAANFSYPLLDKNRKSIDAAALKASQFPGQLAKGAKTVVTKSAERVLTTMDDLSELKRMKSQEGKAF